MKRKALFLDRDGTLIINRHYLADPAGVELLSGVRKALHDAIASGYMLFLFTNQSGVGRGMFTLEAVERCNDRMIGLLDLPKPGFTEICIAPEAPDQPSAYRKPSPRFILEMIEKYALCPEESWMVGDSLADVQAGLNAGIRAALLQAESTVAVPAEAWQCCDLEEFYSKLTAERC